MGDLEYSATAETGVLLSDDRQQRGVVQAAWGEWLSTNWEWDWFVTLQYKPVTPRMGSAGMITGVGWERSDRDWHEWLEDVTHDAIRRDVMSPPYWFRGREPNKDRYGTHFHALVGNVRHVRRSDAWSRWYQAHGNARIEPYDPRRGAGYYVAKYVAKELGDLQFSPNLGLYRRSDNDSAIDDARRQYPAGWSAAGGRVPEREAAAGSSATGWGRGLPGEVRRDPAER